MRYVWRVVTAILLLLALLGATSTVYALPLDDEGRAYAQGNTKTLPEMDVRGLAEDEAKNLEAQGFVFPSYTLIIFNFKDANGLYIHLGKPLRDVVLLLPWYFSEAQARATAAHEFGHMLWRNYGGPMDQEMHELLADYVAACFGTVGAQDWARRVWTANPTAEQCASIKLTLAKGAPTP